MGQVTWETYLPFRLVLKVSQLHSPWPEWPQRRSAFGNYKTGSLRLGLGAKQLRAALYRRAALAAEVLSGMFEPGEPQTAGKTARKLSSGEHTLTHEFRLQAVGLY